VGIAYLDFSLTCIGIFISFRLWALPAWSFITNLTNFTFALTMDAICSGMPFKENHSMEKAFGYYTRFAKFIVTEPSDWQHVKPLFRTPRDATIREYTSEGDQPFGRMIILEFESAIALERRIKSFDRSQEEPNLRGVAWNKIASTAELVAELATMAGKRPEEIYGVGKDLPPGVSDLYAARQKPDYIGVGQQVAVTKDVKILERECSKIGLCCWHRDPESIESTEQFKALGVTSLVCGLSSGGDAVLLGNPRVDVPVRALEGFTDWRRSKRKWVKRAKANHEKPSGVTAVSAALRSATVRFQDLDEAIWHLYEKAPVKADLAERKRVDALKVELEVHLEEATRSARSLATTVGIQRKGKRAKPVPQGGDRNPGKAPVKVEEDEHPQPKKPRGKPAAKDNWLKGSLLARQELLAASSASSLSSVPRKGTEYYDKAKGYAEKLKSGAISAERCAEILATTGPL